MTEVIASVSGIPPIAISASGIAISGIAQLQIPSQETFNQASDNSLTNLQNRNVPIQFEEIVPNDGLAHSGYSPNRISKKEIGELAVQKYTTCGQGIDFSDITKKFGCSKTKAQTKLKYYRRQGTLFTLKRTSPQRYYPSALRADILDRLKQEDFIPIDPTGLTSSNTPLSTLEEQKAQNLLEALLLLGRTSPYVHRLQLQLSIDARYYNDIQKDSSRYNREKQHEERICTALVKYSVYPNGTTMVYVAASKNPFKLEEEADLLTLYSFLGQVRDRLLHLLADPCERIVPPITEWVLTGCDRNKDITVTDRLQLSAINIQLKEADGVLRLYIKSLGDKAVYRVEESVKMHSFIVDALHTVTRTIPSQDYTKYIRDPEMYLLTQDLN
jgi:hypothetical protein